MTALLDRVAKAMARNSTAAEIDDEDWTHVAHKEYWLDLARAAIAAVLADMREPSEAMIAEGCDVEIDYGDIHFLRYREAAKVFAAMIDAYAHEQGIEGKP